MCSAGTSDGVGRPMNKNQNVGNARITNEEGEQCGTLYKEIITEALHDLWTRASSAEPPLSSTALSPASSPSSSPSQPPPPTAMLPEAYTSSHSVAHTTGSIDESSIPSFIKESRSYQSYRTYSAKARAEIPFYCSAADIYPQDDAHSSYDAEPTTTNQFLSGYRTRSDIPPYKQYNMNVTSARLTTVPQQEQNKQRNDALTKTPTTSPAKEEIHICRISTSYYSISGNSEKIDLAADRRRAKEAAAECKRKNKFTAEKEYRKAKGEDAARENEYKQKCETKAALRAKSKHRSKVVTPRRSAHFDDDRLEPGTPVVVYGRIKHALGYWDGYILSSNNQSGMYKVQLCNIRVTCEVEVSDLYFNMRQTASGSNNTSAHKKPIDPEGNTFGGSKSPKPKKAAQKQSVKDPPTSTQSSSKSTASKRRQSRGPHLEQRKQQPYVKTPTHYQVLGLTSSASNSDIRKAYRELALKCHPDKNSKPSASDTFQRVKLAYEILGNEQTRKSYDNKFAMRGRRHAGL